MPHVVSKDGTKIAYEAGSGPDWEGFQNFIISRAEIDRLSAALRERQVE